MALEIAQSALMTRASLELPTPYVAPEGKLETEIAKIFADVLRIDEVGADDDFFDIGGDSIVAETISMEILQRTGCEFPMSSLLDYSSPRTIAAALQRSGPRKDAVEAPTVAETKTRPPIFVLHGRGGYTMPQAPFRQALAEGQKLRMFELPGIRGGRSYDRIEDIAEGYIGQLTAEYPQGPILLASFCAGALIALEMTSQLARMGRPVKHVVLIDPPVSREGTLAFGVGGMHRDLWNRAKGLFHKLLPRPLRLRYYELRWRKRARSKYSDLNLSPAARAKLYAAYLDYSPSPYDGPVTILSSSSRFPAMRDGPHMSKLLPRRTVHLVFAQHHGVTSAPRAAELMQEAFDAALAGG
jgi:acyl carrier protein